MVHSILSGSGRSSEDLLRQAERKRSRCSGRLRLFGALSRGFPDVCFGRRRIPARVARTCFGRHRRPVWNARTCFGRHRRFTESPHPLRRPEGFVPRHAMRASARTDRGGRARSARYPIDGPPTSVDGEAIPGKRLHRLRRVEVLHRLRPMRKVPSRIPATSVVGHGGSGHRATSGMPDDHGRRGSTPALLPRKTSGPRRDGASRPPEAKGANELVRDALRRPGQPGG
jgi:hypothetical protein